MPCERKLRNGEKNPRDYPYWNELLSSLEEHSVVICNDKMPLPQLELYLKSFDLVLTIDSFIQHFCWYHNVPTVVIWGTSDPNIFGHKENYNLLLNRNTLREKQFDIWETEKYNPDVFPDAKTVRAYINENCIEAEAKV
jgi:ADP-heptose:LPS heptosyltransferase